MKAHDSESARLSLQNQYSFFGGRLLRSPLWHCRERTIWTEPVLQRDSRSNIVGCVTNSVVALRTITVEWKVVNDLPEDISWNELFLVFSGSSPYCSRSRPLKISTPGVTLGSPRPAWLIVQLAAQPVVPISYSAMVVLSGMVYVEKLERHFIIYKFISKFSAYCRFEFFRWEPCPKLCRILLHTLGLDLCSKAALTKCNDFAKKRCIFLMFIFFSRSVLRRLVLCVIRWKLRRGTARRGQDN